MFVLAWQCNWHLCFDIELEKVLFNNDKPDDINTRSGKNVESQDKSSVIKLKKSISNHKSGLGKKMEKEKKKW